LYRSCTASFGSESLKLGDLAILGPKRKDDFEAYFQHEMDWLCTIEFLPRDDPEARALGRKHRLLVWLRSVNEYAYARVIGDPDAGAY
jgi:hypothetical protein